MIYNYHMFLSIYTSQIRYNLFEIRYTQFTCISNTPTLSLTSLFSTTSWNRPYKFLLLHLSSFHILRILDKIKVKVELNTYKKERNTNAYKQTPINEWWCILIRRNDETRPYKHKGHRKNLCPSVQLSHTCRGSRFNFQHLPPCTPKYKQMMEPELKPTKWIIIRSTWQCLNQLKMVFWVHYYRIIYARNCLNFSFKW